MNDDWSTPTGELIRDDFADEHTPAPDLLPRTEEAEAHLLDAFLHELALDASDDLTASSSEDQAEEGAIMACGPATGPHRLATSLNLK